MAVRSGDGSEPAGPGHRRRVRIMRLLSIFTSETPIPRLPELAARLGCSVAAIQRDLGTVEFARGLDEALSAELARVVHEAVALHVETMRDAGADRSDRLAAAKWIHARWAGAKRASAAIKGGDEPHRAAALESELLAQVMAETQAARVTAAAP